MTAFSPQTFLTNQGWEGPGSGLRKGSIKKPVTVAHKTNLKGIGKERDTGYAWWDDVFSMVANKKKGSDVALRKTSTGIHSPLPPGSLSAVSSVPASGSVTPIASTSTHFHTDIIGQAKLEAARREFYAKFLRGRPLQGTVEEGEETPASEPEIVSGETGSSQDKLEVKEQKRREKELRKKEKEERRRLRKEVKGEKSKRKAAKAESEESSLHNAGIVLHQPTSSEGGTEANEQSGKRYQMKRKHIETEDDEANEVHTEGSDATLSRAERKAQRAQRRAQKADRMSTSEDTSEKEAVTQRRPNEMTEINSVKPDVSESADAKAARKARKEAKKRRKIETADA